MQKTMNNHMFKIDIESTRTQGAKYVADLGTFTEEIPNEKLHFLCCV